jgi:four helix bundle protein
MPFKFEKLEVWHLSLDYIDQIYQIAEELPTSEVYNLRSQITRAATSVALNIAEGSTGQTDGEQARFLGLAIRSLLESVACLHLIKRRAMLADTAPLSSAYKHAETLAAKLHTLRKTIAPDRGWLREDAPVYVAGENGQELEND